MVNEILITNNGLNNFLNAAYLDTGTVPTKIRVGIGTSSPSEADTDLTNKIPISGTEEVSDCDTANWTDSTDADSTLNTTLFKEGTASISLERDTTTQEFFGMATVSGQLDFTSKELWCWVYLVDTDDLAASSTALEIFYGNDSSNYYYYKREKTDLVDGWNAVRFSTTTADGSVGSVTLSQCDYTNIRFYPDSSVNTIAADRVLVDDFKLASSGDYDQNFDSGYPSVSTTDNSVEMETTLGTTKANGFPISEMGHYTATNSTMYSHSVFTAENKTDSDIFIMKEKIKIINTTT